MILFCPKLTKCWLEVLSPYDIDYFSPRGGEGEGAFAALVRLPEYHLRLDRRSDDPGSLWTQKPVGPIFFWPGLTKVASSMNGLLSAPVNPKVIEASWIIRQLEFDRTLYAFIVDLSLSLSLSLSLIHKGTHRHLCMIKQRDEMETQGSGRTALDAYLCFDENCVLPYIPHTATSTGHL